MHPTPAWRCRSLHLAGSTGEADGENGPLGEQSNCSDLNGVEGSAKLAKGGKLDNDVDRCEWGRGERGGTVNGSWAVGWLTTWSRK
jgi:hypothetical protein